VKPRRPRRGITPPGRGSHLRTMSTPAFGQLVEDHYGSLFRFALSLARNPADAGDLVQQTFLIWATKGHSLNDGKRVKSWLFTTLYREFLRGRRRTARLTSLETMPEGENEPEAAEVDRVARCDAATALAALQEVDEVFRAPLSLFYLEDLSYQEIAAVLQVPVGTVMSRLSRGKTQLRAIFAAAATVPAGAACPIPAVPGGKEP